MEQLVLTDLLIQQLTLYNSYNYMIRLGWGGDSAIPCHYSDPAPAVLAAILGNKEKKIRKKYK